MKSLFRGGIHPADRKESTRAMNIQKLSPGPELIFPMSQHIGAPCRPVVKVGDHILAGQMLGEPGAAVSAPVHSSVSGKVKAITPRHCPIGKKILSVVVENDGLYERAPLETPSDWREADRGEILSRISRAGVVGMGGACFPAHIKLSPPDVAAIDRIVLNGAECEPYLTCDFRLMMERTDEILEGMQILLSLFPRAELILGVEDNKPEVIELFRQKLAGQERATVKALPVRYPQGSEKQLIYALTGRAVPAGGLPHLVGCVVQNVATVAEIFRAVALGLPTTERVLTVTGEAAAHPGNFLVPLGMLISEVIEAAGGFSKTPGKGIAGGPMMGTALKRLAVPVIKGTSGILVQGVVHTLDEEADNCIRCGRCVDVCPMGLLPYKLHVAAMRDDLDGFEAQGGMNCLECGCCSFGCPSKRHLIQSFRDAKRAIRTRPKGA
jgi:electron transport complex protein RnfC